MSIVMLLITLWLIVFQSLIYKRIPSGHNGSKNLRISLEEKIMFYRTKYIKSIYAATLSNPLLLITGFLYYFYLKYGKIRPLDIEDIIVLGFFLVISFVMPLLVQLWYNNYQVRQLEDILSEIDEGSISAELIKKQKRNSFLIHFFSIITLVAGLIILFYLVFSR